MKKLAALLAFTFVTAANAQEASPSIEMVTNQYLLETGQLRVELAKARAEIIALRQQVEDAKKAAPQSKGDKQ